MNIKKPTKKAESNSPEEVITDKEERLMEHTASDFPNDVISDIKEILSNVALESKLNTISEVLISIKELIERIDLKVTQTLEDIDKKLDAKNAKKNFDIAASPTINKTLRYAQHFYTRMSRTTKKSSL